MDNEVANLIVAIWLLISEILWPYVIFPLLIILIGLPLFGMGIRMAFTIFFGMLVIVFSLIGIKNAHNLSSLKWIKYITTGPMTDKQEDNGVWDFPRDWIIGGTIWLIGIIQWLFEYFNLPIG